MTGDKDVTSCAVKIDFSMKKNPALLQSEKHHESEEPILTKLAVKRWNCSLFLKRYWRTYIRKCFHQSVCSLHFNLSPISNISDVETTVEISNYFIFQLFFRITKESLKLPNLWSFVSAREKHPHCGVVPRSDHTLEARLCENIVRYRFPPQGREILFFPVSALNGF